MLAFSVIKLENFRALHKNSIELARLGSPSPNRHPRTFRAIQTLPFAAEWGELCDYRGLRSQASLAPRPVISNREHHLLEHLLTYRKQTKAPRSNRELSTNRRCDNSHVASSLSLSRSGWARASFERSSVSGSAFLPGSARYVECDVTHSKQTAATFLPGATTAHRCLRDSYASRVFLRLNNPAAYRIPRA